MKQITIDVPDNKYPFTMDLIKNLKFVKNITTREEKKIAPPTKAEFIQNLKDAIEEVKLIEAGKKKGTLLKDFLNEL